MPDANSDSGKKRSGANEPNQDESIDLSDSAAEDQEIANDETKIQEDIDAVTDLLKRERDEYLDLARRLQAEFENYKKRVQKQMYEHSERAGELMIEKLLGVLDTMDLALHHEPSGPLEQVTSALRDVLTKEGLERIDQSNVPFNPELHDAVAHEDGDGPPEVIEIMRAGYRYKGKVLRPAMVKVKGV